MMNTLASMFKKGYKLLKNPQKDSHNNTIHLPSGQIIKIQYLGHGTFSDVYLGDDGLVYYVTKTTTEDGLTDKSKEYLAKYLETGVSVKHLPKMELIGNINNNANVQLFRSILYKMPLGLQPEWGINDNSLSRDPKNPWVHPDDEEEEELYWQFDARFKDFYSIKHQKELEDAKEELNTFIDWAYDNGASSIGTDLTSQNMGVDENGTLILVDPIWITK